MKSTFVLLFAALSFIAGTAWVAQEWRLEATAYLTTRERDGDVLRQKLESEGDKLRAETEATYHARGEKESAAILASTEREGRIWIAEADQERTRLKSQQNIVTSEYVFSPLQGTLSAENWFASRALDETISERERDLNRTIYEIITKARANVHKEYYTMLHHIGQAMAERGSCEPDGDQAPRRALMPAPVNPFARVAK